MSIINIFSKKNYKKCGQFWYAKVSILDQSIYLTFFYPSYEDSRLKVMRFFSDYDCDSCYHNKWVTQKSMEVFTPCDCDNIINSYSAYYEQNQIAVANRTV